MKIYENEFSDGCLEKTVELENRDKWWLQKLFNINELNKFNEVIISFKFEKNYPIPIFDNTEPDYIQIFNSDEIKDILLNSKSRAKKYFYYEFIKVK